VASENVFFPSQNHRPLRQIAVALPASGISRTRCDLDKCTRTPGTPQPEQRCSPSISRSTHRPADGSSPTAITRYPGRLNNVLAASRGEPIRSAMVHGFVTARVTRQHESQQIHGPPTSYDTGPDFTRNHEEPPTLIHNGNRAYSRANLRDRHFTEPA
jgi:hypothetical protein